MKKILIMIFGLSFLIPGIHIMAQMDRPTPQVKVEAKIVEVTRAYVQADFGFAFGLDPSVANQVTTGSNGNLTNQTVEAVKVRLGTGMPFEVAGGYMFNEHFGIEMGIVFDLGFPTKVTDNFGGVTSTTKLSATMLSLVPAVRAQMKAGPVIPYIRIGPEIGIMNNYITRGPVSTSTSAGTTSGERNTRDYGGVAVGIKASAGVEYPLTKLISIFGEIQARAISFTPKHGKVTKYVVNGEDKMADLSTKQSKWDYVKTITFPDGIPSDQPDQLLRVTHSMSDAAIAFGVKFNFGK
jgi:hypothetical protein